MTGRSALLQRDRVPGVREHSLPVAGLVGALVSTVAMCGPTTVLAYYVSRFMTRSPQATWPALLRAALVPLSIGLMSASGLVLVETARGYVEDPARSAA